MMKQMSAAMAATAPSTAPLEHGHLGSPSWKEWPWLWNICKGTVFQGFESKEFQTAFNGWNWSYWLLLVLTIVPANVVLAFLGPVEEWRHGLSPHLWCHLVAVSCCLVSAVMVLWFAPQRGHLVMSWVVLLLFVSHYLGVALVAEECYDGGHWHLGCGKLLALCQPPLYLVVFVLASCRLRPLLPMVMCVLCCCLSTLWSLAVWSRFSESAEDRKVELEIVFSSLLGGVACVLGAQVGILIFRKQREIFEYLNDHLNLHFSGGEEHFGCEFDMGDSTRLFFRSYSDRVPIAAFVESEETSFRSWRCELTRQWTRSKAPYLLAGVLGLTVSYLSLAWERHSQGRLPLSAAILQTVVMLVASTMGAVLNVCPASDLVAVCVFLLCQLIFSLCLIWCGPGDGPSITSMVPKGFWDTDPLVFLIFSRHLLLNLEVRRAIAFDLAICGLFLGVTLFRHDSLNLELCFSLLVTVLTCQSVSLSLEKYDRILWKLQQREDSKSDLITSPESFEEQVLFRAPLVQEAQDPSRNMAPPDLEISVLGFTTQLALEVFYYIELSVAGQGKQVALMSVHALRTSFLQQLELARASSVSTMTAIPFFDNSFDGLSDATDEQIWHAARRLERILGRSLRSTTVARAVLGLDETGRSTALVPRMDVLLLAAGTQGDVQPFVALARALNEEGHRCRLAAHSDFEELGVAAGVEFFPLASNSDHDWTPRQWMEDVESGGGLGPDLALRPQDLYKAACRTPDMSHTLQQLLRPLSAPAEGEPAGGPSVGPWAAAVQPDPATGRPFVAQALIANPQSFAHVHIAERLGIPCHLASASPWSPTTLLGHPLSGPRESGVDQYWEKLEFRWMDGLQWLGSSRLGTYLNMFRRDIGLSQLGLVQLTPSVLDETKVPFLHLHSPALLKRPLDWGPHIEVCGFLNGRGSATASPPAALQRFLEAGEPPVYVGFGSVTTHLEELVYAIVMAVLEAGHRVVLQQGWAQLGALALRLPDEVFYIGGPGDEELLRKQLAAGTASLGSVEHDWLFPRCRALCHHGGSGTTHRGLRYGRPSLVIAFVGDQPLWGGLMESRGAGRLVCASKATRTKLAAALSYVLSPEAAAGAEALCQVLDAERRQSPSAAVEAFHRQLPVELLQCDVCRHAACVVESLISTRSAKAELAAQKLPPRKDVHLSGLCQAAAVRMRLGPRGDQGFGNGSGQSSGHRAPRNPMRPRGEQQDPSLHRLDVTILMRYGLWSRGIHNHGNGKCRPCHYAHTQQGCRNGAECEFCHLPHTRSGGTRPCKTKRLHCKRVVSIIEEVARERPEQVRDLVHTMSSQSAYMVGVMQRRWVLGQTEDGDSSDSSEGAEEETGIGPQHRSVTQRPDLPPPTMLATSPSSVAASPYPSAGSPAVPWTMLAASPASVAASPYPSAGSPAVPWYSF